MRAIIAAGGTAGHINPALAIGQEIMANEPDSKLLFVGYEKNMEKTLVEKAGFDFYSIEMHSFVRSFRPDYVLWNIKTFFVTLSAERKTKKLLKAFKPDIVIGCGGFISGPVVRTAAKMHIKTAIHEQNAFPGLSNKLVAKQVDCIMAALPQAVEKLGYPEKTVVTGNPVRREILEQNREAARRDLGVGKRICILAFGGSLGAGPINDAVAGLIEWIKDKEDFYLIHGTGKRAYEAFCAGLKEKGINYEAMENLDLRPYISDMPRCLAAADLVVSRSGAITISELAASGRASILIPAPNVTENHQYYNAMSLVNAGAASLLEQKDLSAKTLVDRVVELTSDRNRLDMMGISARNTCVKDSQKIIYRAVSSLVKGEKA